MNSAITVIGGANVDIGGRPAAALALRDSSPGYVSQRYGGVGRNIAHDLRLLGEPVNLIAAFGGDLYGEGLRESCLALGMDLSMALFLPERRSSTYLYLCDERGEMLAAVSDMEIVRCLTPEALEGSLERLNASRAVVVDANLEEETIRWLAQHCTAPLYADPVSSAKAPRLRPLLGRLRALKPNALEAAALTGETEPEAALRALLALGVKRVFLSRGAQGLLVGEGETLFSLPCEDRPVVDATGAGDAALAAVVWADLQGWSLRRCAAAALRAGAVACSFPEANPPQLLSYLEELKEVR